VFSLSIPTVNSVKTQLFYCQLKWWHVSTQGVIIRPIIEPCLRYIKWKCKWKFSQNTTILLSIKVVTCFDSRSHHQANYWTMFEVHQVKVHFHLMYLKHGSIISLMMTPWVKTCHQNHVWGTSSESASESSVKTQLYYCQLKWWHVLTQGVIIRLIIEPCLRYIKWKCTFTWCTSNMVQ